MTLKTRNFYVKNQTALAVVPAVVPHFAKLDELIAALILADTGSLADLTGYALRKANKRRALELLAQKVSNAVTSYAVDNDDVVLEKRADTPSSKWAKCSEEELVTLSTIMKDLAGPIAGDLADYGATEQEVTDLETAIASFISVISDPSLATDGRKEDNVQVLKLADDIRTLFNDKLDKLMRSFEVDYPMLHRLYGDARAIDENGAIQAPTAEKEVQPSSSLTLHTAAAYNADTLYTFRNEGSEPLAISLSTTDNQAGPVPVLLLPGETRTRLAQNLAPAGTYLVAQNDSASAVSVKVWVES